MCHGIFNVVHAYNYALSSKLLAAHQPDIDVKFWGEMIQYNPCMLILIDIHQNAPFSRGYKDF